MWLVCLFIMLTLSLNTDIRPAYSCCEAYYLLCAYQGLLLFSYMYLSYLYNPVNYCLERRMFVLVYWKPKGSTIKTVLWPVKASYIVFALSGLIPFSYHLLLRAPIEALIASFACLLLYPVNFKPKHWYQALIWLMQGFFPIMCLIKVNYSLAICIKTSQGLVKYCLW